MYNEEILKSLPVPALIFNYIANRVIARNQLVEEYLDETFAQNILTKFDAIDFAQPILFVKDGLFFEVVCNLLTEDLALAIVRNVVINREQDSRLEMLGFLAGGVAHDFNNFLTGILGHINYLKHILPGSGEHVESLNAIHLGARKSSELTTRILNLAKSKDASSTESIDLSQSLTACIKLLKGSISPEYFVEYQECFEDKKIFVRTMEAMLCQVITNLVINARDAMEIGGSIKVNVSLIEEPIFKGVYICSTGFLSDKLFVKLVVKDDGSGLSKDLQSKIFDPLFTTKKEKGTGLGLSIIANFAESVGGAVDFDSTLGKGTEVSVYIPVERIEEVTQVQPTPQFEGQGIAVKEQKPRVLIVDDEELVRNVLKTSFVHLGFQVTCTESGTAGIEALKVASYDLLVLDMVMVDMSGSEAFSKLRQIDPDIRVLLISGMYAPDSVDVLLREPKTGFLKKPFTIKDLQEKLGLA